MSFFSLPTVSLFPKLTLKTVENSFSLVHTRFGHVVISLVRMDMLHVDFGDDFRDLEITQVDSMYNNRRYVMLVLYFCQTFENIHGNIVILSQTLYKEWFWLS